MNNTTYILVVDDNQLNRENLQEVLEDAEQNYVISCVENGIQCLSSVAEKKPNLILMDVNMPNKSGLETCQELKNNEASKDIPIIFVSSLASDDECLKGYKAGGDDYITRPFKNGELLLKVNFHLNNIAEKNTLKETSQDSMTMANIAWDTSFEMGQVLTFIKSTFNCKTHHELSEQLFSFLASFGMSGSLMLRRTTGYQFFFSDDKERDLEKNLLTKIHNFQDRIVEYKHRRIFNSDHAVLLIRNMTFDEETLGRYRDHFAILIEGIDARTNALNDELALKKKQKVIENMEKVHENMKNIDQQHQFQRVKNSQIVSQLISNVEDSFIHLGLDEDQEKYLLGLVQKVEKETDALYNAGHQLNKKFEYLMDNLNSVVNREVAGENCT